jgi:hypothetical protein
VYSLSNKEKDTTAVTISITTNNTAVWYENLTVRDGTVQLSFTEGNNIRLAGGSVGSKEVNVRDKTGLSREQAAGSEEKWLQRNDQ